MEFMSGFSKKAFVTVGPPGGQVKCDKIEA